MKKKYIFQTLTHILELVYLPGDTISLYVEGKHHGHQIAFSDF